MKPFTLLLTVAAALFTGQRAAAQFSIDEVDVGQNAILFKNEIKTIPANVDYFSPARYRAERAAVRKERNFLELGGGLQGSLVTQNHPWIQVSGGDNSIAVVATFYLHHIFTKNNFIVETRFDASIGYNRMKVDNDNAWYKNQDALALSVAPGFKMAPYWSYGANFAFRSQFANGFVARKKHQTRADMQSQFMTPAYLDMSLGITFHSPSARWPFTITFSPIALSTTYARNAWIRMEQHDGTGAVVKPAFNYGIEDPMHSSKYEGGSSIQLDYDRTFGKKGVIRYRTSFFSFYGWITNIGRTDKISNYTEYKSKNAQWLADNPDPLLADYKDKPHLPIHPTVRWTNTIDIKATKYLTTTLSFSMLYDRSQNTSIQTQTLLSVGLMYTFKNK